MVGFGLVVFWPAQCAACFVGSASSSPPFARRVRVALVGGWVTVAFVLFARTLLLPVRQGGFARCGGAWLGLLSCVLPGGRRCRVRVGGARGGVLADAMRGLFCLFGVVFAALRSACSVVLIAWTGLVLCWCAASLLVRRAVLVRARPLGGTCCVGVWPPLWWGVLYCFVAPVMVGRAVLVRGPTHGGACCVGARRPRWWCVVCWCLGCIVVVCWVAAAVVLFASPGLVLCWCVDPPLLGRAVFVRAPPPWWGVLCWHARVSVRGLVAGSMLGLFCWFAVVSAAVRPALSDVGCLWCSPFRGWCSAAACPPTLLGRAVLARAPPSWWGVLCWCVPPPWWGVLRLSVAPLMVGRAVFVRAPPLVGRAVLVPSRRGGGAWFRSVVFGLGCRRLLVGLRLRLCGLLGRGWCCVGACPPLPLLWRAVFVRAPPPWWGVRCRRVWVSVRGVVAGSMLGFFCWFAVVSAAARPALSGVGCLWCLPGRGWCRAGWCPPPPPVRACCACAWPPPLVARAVLVCPLPMAGRAVLVCGLPCGGACCVGAWPPSWSGVLYWCLPDAVLVRGLIWWCLAWVVVLCWVGCGCGCVACLAGVGAVLARAPPPVGACHVCAWPTPRWGVWCGRVWVYVRGVVASSMLSLFCWFAVVSAAARPALSGVGCLWCLPGRGWCCAGACLPPGWGVLCLCVAPPMVGRAVLVCALPMVGRTVWVCGPLHGGACCVGSWPPSWWDVLCWCLRAAVVVVGFGCRHLLGGLRLRLCCLLPWGWCFAGAWPTPVGACSVCASPPRCWGVLRRRVWVLVRGVVGGSMPGLFCRFAVVSAAVRPALSGVGCLWCLPGRGRCCAGAWWTPVGACCVSLWPQPWWGVLRRRVWFSVRGVVAGSMLGLFCWFMVVSAAVRPALSGVGCLWYLPGRDGQASLPGACGAPPLCAGRVGRAGLPSACPAPRRVFVSRVLSPCRSFSLARPPLSRVCAAPGRALVFVAACCCARPTPSHPTPPLRLLSSASPFAS